MNPLHRRIALLLLSCSFTAVAQHSGRQLFNILDYGAKNDGSTPVTAAFKNAIAAAKATGGGTIYVPPGKYSSGPIELFSNMTLDVRTPVFRNIAIRNVTIDGAKQVVDIEGLPEMRITGLRLTDVTGSGKSGLLATYTDALELHHVQVTADKGSAFKIDAASNLLLDDITTAKPSPNEGTIRLTHAPGAILRDSRAFPGTGVFLSTAPGELKSMILSGNTLQNASKPTDQR